MYVKVTNGVATEYTMGHLRRDNPNVSFPRTCSDELLASYGMYPFTHDPKPDCDYTSQYIDESFEERDGAWYRKFTVVNLPQEDAERNVREERDSRLAKTDWMALSDVTMSPEWAAYRQELRDISDQVGFPFSIAWPIEPINSLQPMTQDQIDALLNDSA